MAHNHNNPAHFGIRTKDFKLIFFYGVNYVKPEERAVYADGLATQNVNDSKSWESSDYPNIPTPVAWELYDLRVDPKEMNNCYSDPKYADVIKSLKAELKDLRERINETDVNYPHIQAIIDANWDK